MSRAGEIEKENQPKEWFKRDGSVFNDKNLDSRIEKLGWDRHLEEDFHLDVKMGFDINRNKTISDSPQSIHWTILFQI